MNREELSRVRVDLEEFLFSLTDRMGRSERRAAMSAYVSGLLLDGDRKSIEPMAARLVDSASEIQAMRQRLSACVTEADWSDEEAFSRLAVCFERELPGVEAFVVDDTGFPKKGTYSVGVERQYSGTLGRVENCQVATSLHLAGEAGSGCIGLRLYLPESWTNDRTRCKRAGVPSSLPFRRKWENALDLLDAALRAGVRRHVVLADAGYGDASEFRDGLDARGMAYVVTVSGTALVWPPDSRPRLPAFRKQPGRPATRYRDARHTPESIKRVAERLEYRTVCWREGSKGWQRSRFAAQRVQLAPRRPYRAAPSDPVWLISQWPDGESEPVKYALSNLPASTSLRALVRWLKLRWRVERDYQELKSEVGLDHFEGRSWRGFHHHAALCAVAHGFLALQRALFPPEDAAMDASDGSEVSPADLAPNDRRLSAMPPNA